MLKILLGHEFSSRMTIINLLLVYVKKTSQVVNEKLHCGWA